MPAVPVVTMDSRLTQAAQLHAQDNAQNDFLSHTGSDGSRLGQRVTAQNYTWSNVGENIAAGQTSEADVMAGWLASPGHCRNIMSANFTQFGGGYALSPVSGSYYGRYWVQVFARSR